MHFADILASLIHDMKNSLWLVINTLEAITAEPLPGAETDKVFTLQQEAKRLNTNLIELLTLYKIENERISPNIEELNVADFLEELVLENQATANAQRVNLTWECDHTLSGFFDEGLIRGVVNSLIGNGMRYTATNLLVSAAEQEGYLVIRVEDDGKGFDPKNTDEISRFGLNSMENRARSINAEFSIDSELGKGTVVTLQMHLKQNKKDENTDS